MARAGVTFAAVGLAALAAGAGLWWLDRASPDGPALPSVSPGALYAATFRDTDGNTQALGQFIGRIVVANFWATWCGPCREEMPAFQRLQARWTGRGVQFVGLANDAPDKVARFRSELGIGYPLWIGGEDVSDLSRRLGNRQAVLPFTVILGRDGQVLETKVGAYTETVLDAKLQDLASIR